MAEHQYDPYAYEGRYRKVYEAGAKFWEEPVPTEALVKFLAKHKSRKGLNALDVGCGEGRDSVFLAKKGFNVTGVDVSQSALRRAKPWSKKKKLEMGLLVGDVVNLPMKDETFDLVVNVDCLNMMTIQDARDGHLLESYRVLKNGGTYFSCNAAVDQSTSVEEFYEKLGKEPGTLTPRKIRVDGEAREIFLPVIAAWPKSKEEYLEEFEKAGFEIAEVSKADTKPVGECWVLVARKQHRN